MKKDIFSQLRKQERQNQKRFSFVRDGGLFYLLLFLCITVVGITGHIVRERNQTAIADGEKQLAEQIQVSVVSDGEQAPHSDVTEETSVFEGMGSHDGNPLQERESSGPLIEIQENKNEGFAEARGNMEEGFDEARKNNLAGVQRNGKESLSRGGENVPETAGFPTSQAENAYVQQDASSQAITLIPPVAGGVLKAHSDTELVYSKTMEDWRLHQGMDIRADIGATVSAAADGTIVETGEDMRFGRYIVIDHGAIKTRYCNLASTDMVRRGNAVSKGDAIGVVGDTASFEIAEEAHLHFEVIADGKVVNPEDYFG
ncbi:MAG: M23 family metallopeptidase [Ruminococcaceae bacterium]|nr:M23 family metallopeptidase [Oscillospiraceae bacterium]